MLTFFMLIIKEDSMKHKSFCMKSDIGYQEIIVNHKVFNKFYEINNPNGQDIEVITYDALSNSSIDQSYSPAGLNVSYEPVDTYAFKLKSKTEESKNKQFTAKSGQSVFDLAIQLYGDISQAIKILSENNGIANINSNNLANLSISYTEQDKFLTKHLKTSNLIINTGYS